MKAPLKDKVKLAIIGASTGQLPIVKKAKERDIHTICFAWEEGAVCKEYCDEFYPLSIFETDKIIEICRKLDVNGICTSASETTIRISSIVAKALNLNCTDPSIIEDIQNKEKVRLLTNNIDGLASAKVWHPCDIEDIVFPCVVKPVSGSAKKGVSYCASYKDFDNAIQYAYESSRDIIIEEYISGSEYSVEVLSFHGKHQVVQITEKVSSGFPHFVELEHHQPAEISDILRDAICDVIPRILDAIGFTNGASHIEIKVNEKGIYLIEVNPRAGGDRISDTLIALSTDCDYISSIIDIALDSFVFKTVKNISHSGIFYLTALSEKTLELFETLPSEYVVEKKRINDTLTVSSSNYDRDGYIIYNNNKRIYI